MQEYNDGDRQRGHVSFSLTLKPAGTAKSGKQVLLRPLFSLIA
jgi:hypothetical protein